MSQARQILKKLLCGPIRFTPVREVDERYYTYTAPSALDRLIAGTIGAMLASPTGVVPEWTRPVPGEVPTGTGKAA